MATEKKAQAEPIPGYRLIELLGKGGFGEVWKGEAPGGLFKAIKFVYGNLNGLEADADPPEDELRAIERIKAIRHPFLLSMDRVENVGGELLIVTELADRNLEEVLRHHQRQGERGIPRAELLGYLREAAEVLDLMNERYGLQHLDVKPRNLFLVSNHVKVADFGLVSRLGGAQGEAAGSVQLAGITPLYASPEIFQGKISPRSDQYSLAIVYLELLTGALPFRGKNARQLLLAHLKGEPDLSLLPEEDRPIVARALAKNPDERFSSCAELVNALAEAAKPRTQAGGNARARPGRLRGRRAAGDTVEPLHGDTADTDLLPARRDPVPTVAALPRYRFLERLCSGPLADVWKVKAPDGTPRLVRFIYGLGDLTGARQEEALVRLRTLRHPALNPVEVVQSDPGRLVLVSDLAGQTFRQRRQQCQAQGQAGVPREELLDVLGAAAEVLDYLQQQHALGHLMLNPRNLLLEKGRLQVAEFGLAHLLWLPAGQCVARQNARYAAPELFARQAARTSDQYSLAVIFQEMLTGRHPFRGRAAMAQPDLDPLPAADREAVARALADDPQQRWPGCTALIGALAAGSGGPVRQAAPDAFVEQVCAARAETDAGQESPPHAALQRLLDELLGNAAVPTGASRARGCEAAGAAEALHDRFRATLPLGVARQKLEALRQQWYGRAIRDDEQGFVFHINLPTNFWRQWIGRQPGLEVRVELSRPHALSATAIDVAAQVRPFRCNAKRAARLLAEMGLPLLDALRACLLSDADKRTKDRLLWPYPVQVRVVAPDGRLGPAVACRGKDISPSGIGFYLPHALASSQVSVCLPTAADGTSLSIPAILVRARKCADGWYDVGALFRVAELRRSLQAECGSS